MERWLQDTAEWLRPRQPEMVRLLGEAVSIESGSRDRDGVNRFSDWMADKMEALGFNLSRFPRESSGDHLRGELEGVGEGRVLLLGHLDTVWPSGTLDGWPFRADAGRAYGPGVADMKGGLVSAIFALQALKAVDAATPKRLLFLLIADEELGSPTGRALVESEAQQCDAVLVLEPARPGGEIVTARGGVGVCEINVTGRSAHTASFLEAGASAIEELSRLVLQLHALSRIEARIFVNVGLVQGGSARQVVADKAWALVDLRAPTAESAATLEERVRAIAASTLVGTSVSATVTWTRPPAPKSRQTERLLAVAQGVAQELGIALADTSTGAGSDGSFAAAIGVPMLDGLGPVSGRICSRDEYVELDSIVPRTQMLAGIVGRLAKA